MSLAFSSCARRHNHFPSRKCQTYHPNKPLNSLPVLITIVRERDLVILVVLLAKVQLHAGTFKNALRLAGSVVHERWDAAVCYKIKYSQQSNLLYKTTSSAANLVGSMEWATGILRLISRNHGSFC
jgi:hypothetical protein